MTTADREDARRELEEQVAQAPIKKKMQWRLGRRGAFLVLMGSLYIILAHIYGFREQPAEVLDQLSMPIQVGRWVGFNTSDDALTMWGVLWTSAGAAAIITAWWPPGRDGWGFISLWTFSASWAMLNLWGGLVLDAPRAVSTGIIFSIYAAAIIIVSGMPDPSPISKVAEEAEQ